MIEEVLELHQLVLELQGGGSGGAAPASPAGLGASEGGGMHGSGSGRVAPADLGATGAANGESGSGTGGAAPATLAGLGAASGALVLEELHKQVLRLKLQCLDGSLGSYSLSQDRRGSSNFGMQNLTLK